MKINWKPVKEIAELLGMVLAYGLIMDATNKFVDHMSDESNNVIAGYDDAISAIMKSGMFSHDKADAAAILKRNGNAEFYRAIIHIAEDDGVFSHDKANMIKALSKN